MVTVVVVVISTDVTIIAVTSSWTSLRTDSPTRPRSATSLARASAALRSERSTTRLTRSSGTSRDSSSASHSVGPAFDEHGAQPGPQLLLGRGVALAEAHGLEQPERLGPLLVEDALLHQPGRDPFHGLRVAGGDGRPELRVQLHRPVKTGVDGVYPAGLLARVFVQQQQQQGFGECEHAISVPVGPSG